MPISDLIRLSRISPISRRVSPHSSNWPSREPLLDQVADQALDPGGGRLGEGPAGALDGVGDHQDAGLLGLRLGPGIAERAFLDHRGVGVAVVPPVGLVIEVLDQRRAVVLLDQVDDPLGQVVLSAQVDAVLDVADDDQRAHRRGQVGVPVGCTRLVLDEIVGLEHLADVVEVGPDAHQQGMGPDPLGGPLGDRARR